MQLIARASFKQSAEAVPHDAIVNDEMGEYLPVGRYIGADGTGL
jgi:hypothetical protein